MTPARFFTLVDTFAKLSLKADAQRFFLGYIWWILEPLLYVGVFYVVFHLVLGTRQPDYLIFLAVGKFSFVWFSKSVNQAANSIVLNRGIIAGMDLPKTLFPLAVVQEGLYKQLAVFVLLGVVLIIDGYQPSFGWFWVLPIILVQYLVIVLCSLIAAVLVCLQRDFSMLINLGMIFMMFVSGVFWDVNSLPNPEATNLILTWNPLALLLDSYRQVLMYQNSVNGSLLGAVAGAALVGILGVSAFYQRFSHWIARKVVSA